MCRRDTTLLKSFSLAHTQSEDFETEEFMESRMYDLSEKVWI